MDPNKFQPYEITHVQRDVDDALRPSESSSYRVSCRHVDAFFFLVSFLPVDSSSFRVSFHHVDASFRLTCAIFPLFFEAKIERVASAEHYFL